LSTKQKTLEVYIEKKFEALEEKRPDAMEMAAQTYEEGKEETS